MSFKNPQPGDTEPHDSAKPGDAAKAMNSGGANTRGGDRAPRDAASSSDERKVERQTHEEDAPLNQSSDPHSPGSVGQVHFSAPFINRPAATFLLSIAILIAGAVAYTLLPASSLPQVEYPVISVGASFPGADPNTMASAVATPLERQFSRIAGINEMTSSSSNGSTSITMQFDLTRDIDGAARDVQAAINAARAQLPVMPSNPTYRKINPADSPILIFALTSDTATVGQMYDASDSILAQKIAQIDGVGQTFTGGSAKPAVRIEANPSLLTSYGLSLDNLRAAIGTVNVLKPTGYVNGDGENSQRVRIATSDQLYGAAAYAPLIIATDRGPVSSAAASTGLPASVASAVASVSSTGANSGSSGAGTAGASTGNSASTPTVGTASLASPNATTSASTTGGTGSPSSGGASRTANGSGTSTTSAQNFATSRVNTLGAANEHGIVRIRDVADVVDSVEDIHTAGMFNGKPAILVVVFKTPEANVISTVNKVLAQMPTLQASIPPNIHMNVVLDRTATIRASVTDVERTMLISIVLVALVVFLFLREGRSTIIPSVSVPLSLMGTFGIMYLLGYTKDNLSLMALTISTGFVVDDAIVVIENIMRHLEEGKSPYDAAMLGSKEIGFTVLSMSISLIAVFIPILCMPGIIGRLFREFAVTLSAAIAVSLMVSLTATPMLSAKFLKPHDETKKGWFYRTGEKHLATLSREYERALRWVLRHRLTVGVVFLATFALNIYLFTIVPLGFFPEQDTGRLSGHLQLQQDTSFATMKPVLQSAVKTIMSDPGVTNVLGFAGGGGPGGGASNSASMYVTLSDSDQRAKTGDTPAKIIGRLRPKLANIPGGQLYLQSSQELRIGGHSSSALYQYSLTADTEDQLEEWTPKLEDALKRLPELKDVNTDLLDAGLETYLQIDRDTAARLGVSPLSIDSAMSSAFGQRQVSTTYRALNQYHVVMEAAQPYQQTPEDIRGIYVKSSSGAQIPLSAVVKLTTARVPLSVSHQGLSPASTISFNLTPGQSLGQATVAIENARAKIGMPSTIHGGFAGTAQAAQASFSSEPLLLLLALGTVYVVLGILYESFIHPLTILSTLPSAAVGALLALLLFKIDLSIIAGIGIILLIGIVKKNAIMMIDFALVAEREHGKAPVDAIYEACILRFRPIMMTTMAAMLGAVPLAFSHSTGAELRQPLGVTIIGGLLVSQCLTLFTTPVIYLFFDWLKTALPYGIRWAWFELGFGARPQRPVAHRPAAAAGD